MTKHYYADILARTSEVAKMGSWEVDLQEETIYWSEITKMIHGVPLEFECDFEQAIGFYKDADSYNTITTAFQNAVEKHKEYDVKVLITTLQGQEKWVRAIGIPVVENGICIRVYGLFQDIDLETREHQKYVEELSKFQEIFKNSFVGLALVNIKGEFTEVNDNFCQMLGYSKPEFLQRSFKDITHPEDQPQALLHFKELKEGADHISTEKRYVTRNNATIWAQIFVSPVKDEKGNTLHYIAQVINIDQRKKAEIKSKELQSVTEEQNKRLLNFAHIVSHNLRSHSGNINMLLDIVYNSIPDFATNEAGKHLVTAAENLTETIHHLNEVVAVQAQSHNLKRLNLVNYVGNTLKVLAGEIIDSKCVIFNNVDENIFINFVPAYLESILLNILSNAIKYKAPNRIPEIHITTSDTQEYISIAIADNGRGIDLNRYGQKLFGMYKTFHEHKEARGIGLFITKNQMESLQGKIEVASIVDKGSTFTLSFKKSS
ncbi:PAS domain S-box-containing protein [Pustulibacterium marinum]|uniref:histidine kinase n=1 Tax=Pustulibacterium marinum TaxID=1224947 RepID=A0A1I7IN26_9FLAO|nr:PAS domain-containing sensor histidine kinase [Pustulibacterium marinum]SFU74333.1 PAS domain S-box-containing protein [Pustulibacterium marinum]